MLRSKKGETYLELETILTALEQYYIEDFKSFACVYLSMINYIEIINKMKDAEKQTQLKSNLNNWIQKL